MPILIEIMNSPTHIEVKEQTIWCLGNISGDNTRFRDALLDQGVLPKICELIDEFGNANSSFTRNAIWTLSNLCKGKPPAEFSRVQRAIPTFAKVVKATDQAEILNDIIWTLSYITDEGGDERSFHGALTAVEPIRFPVLAGQLDEENLLAERSIQLLELLLDGPV